MITSLRLHGMRERASAEVHESSTVSRQEFNLAIQELTKGYETRVTALEADNAELRQLLELADKAGNKKR